MSSEAHVMPIGDLAEHEQSDECVCGPALDGVQRADGSYYWVIVHHSLDGREREA